MEPIVTVLKAALLRFPVDPFSHHSICLASHPTQLSILIKLTSRSAAQEIRSLYLLRAPIMCQGIRKIHAHCHHYRSKEVHRVCRYGYDFGLGGCNGNRLNMQTIYIYAPPLCPVCYRARESEVCSTFDERLGDAEAKLARSKETLEKAQKGHEMTLKKPNRGDYLVVLREECEYITGIVKTIEKWEKVAGKLKIDKERKLVNFRQEMGVWGDG